MVGYKAFNEDLKCRGFQYEIGSTYEFYGSPVLCKQGFHFCKTIGQCYNFYPIDSKTRICKIEALGDIVESPEKCCTNRIKILEEITDLQEKHANISSSSTGYFNTGRKNSGHYNVGDCNSGSYNVGNGNTGNNNTGWHNDGNNNAGDCNAGWGNTGNHNSGDKNTGVRNFGSNNTGDYNIGSCNTGDRNVGIYNTGNFNLGDYNSGDYNLGSYSTGCFNTKEEKIKFFDKPSDYTYAEWAASAASRIMYQLMSPVFDLIDCSTEEREEVKQAVMLAKEKGAQVQWDSLTAKEQGIIKSLPNFDAEIFYQCTGIKVD